MQYQAVVFISDAEDSLEAAELLAPLKGVERVKVGTIMPRPEPKAAIITGPKILQPPEKRSPLPPEHPQ